MNQIEEELKNSYYHNYIECNYNNNDLQFTIENPYDNKIDIEDAKGIISLIHEISIKKKIYIKNSIETLGQNINNINFDYCTFLDNVYFENCTFKSEISFNNCVFEKELCLYNSKFLENIRFHNSIFKTSVNFENTTFHKLVDFYESSFKETQQFLHTDFFDRAIFSHVTFEKETEFIYNKVKSDTYISFENARINQLLNISKANFNCNLQFWNINFNKNTSLRRIDKILKSSNDNDKYKIASELKESFRIIKNSFNKTGNSTSEIEIKSLEFKAHMLECLYGYNIKKTPRLISMFLNLCSNNFGTNWFLALFFTLLCTVISYIILLKTGSNIILIDYKYLSENIYDCLKILNITKWDFDDTLFFHKENKSIYSIIFIARLFIGYGIYQFIQAFKVFGKK